MCVIPKENSNNLNCSKPEELLQAFTRIYLLQWMSCRRYYDYGLLVILLQRHKCFGSQCTYYINIIYFVILSFLGYIIYGNFFFEVGCRDTRKLILLPNFTWRHFEGEKSAWIPFWCFFDMISHQTLNQQSCDAMWSAKH